MTSARRRLLSVLWVLAALGVCFNAAPAAAERPASAAEFAAIDRLFSATERTLHVRLEWVQVSSLGPFALAYMRGGQDSAVVLRGSGTHWRNLATISDEGLRCGLVPPAVVEDLHLERFNEGPHPCS